MDNLIAFVRNRLDELERIALAAGEAPEARQWAAGPDHVEDGERGIVARYRDDDRPLTGARAVHIARHDPARVLADIEAKRRIIHEYERVLDERRAHPKDLGLCGALLALHGVVKLLAAAHAAHPDYRPEWKPDTPEKQR